MHNYNHCSNEHLAVRAPWCQHRSRARFCAKRLFSILQLCALFVFDDIARNIAACWDCIVCSHIAINQPKLSDASLGSPHTIVSDICCMIYWIHPPLHCTMLRKHWCAFLYQLEVNAGSLDVLSDHIADHSGPGAKINLQHFRLHRNSDHSFWKTASQT